MDKDDDINYQRLCNSEKLKNGNITFTQSLDDNPMTPRSETTATVDSTSEYIEKSLIPYIKAEMKLNLPTSVSKELLGIINSTLDECRFPLEDFKTETDRFNIYAEKCGFTLPDRQVVGKNPDTDEDIEVVNIPIGTTLKNFLELPGVYKSIRKNMENLKVSTKVGKFKVISNIIQGEMYKKKYSKDDGRNAIPIFFSYDDAESRGPISSHAGEQKLGLGYVTIPVLEPHLVAKLDNVFLALIFLAKNKKYLKNIDIFGPLIKELKDLSINGITINCDGKQEKEFFDCLLFIGDNLGQNEVCGFNYSFNAKYYCRICFATSEECKELFVENKSLLRDIESYISDVIKKSRGVLEECIFNKLPRFHICENLSLDMMHDLLGGEGKDTLELVLTEVIIKDKAITLLDFNKKLKQFDFGYETSNRPRPLKIESCIASDAECYGSSTKIKAKQSASQMLCFLRYLPFILDNLIPTNSPTWNLYILLRKIIGLVTSPEYLECDIDQVQILIEQFLKLFSTVYRMKPKPHFMIHIPLIMKNNGPLVHFWAMSTERKHRFARKVALGTSSSRDLPWTIGVKYQLSLSRRNQTFKYDEKDYELGPIVNDNVLSFHIKQFHEEIRSITLFKYITMFGHKFCADTIFIHGFDSNDLPTFLRLKAIVEINSELFFFACFLTTKRFVQTYHAYEISKNSTSYNLIKLDEIERKPPCLLYKKSENKYYVACRYD